MCSHSSGTDQSLPAWLSHWALAFPLSYRHRLSKQPGQHRALAPGAETSLLVSGLVQRLSGRNSDRFSGRTALVTFASKVSPLVVLR